MIPSTTDRIEKTIELKAPIKRVWRALTDYQEFGEWFRVRLDGPFAPGKTIRGNILHAGYEHLCWEAVIQKMEPERLFSGRLKKAAYFRSISARTANKAT